MAETRETLREVARLCDALPDEVEHRGVEGEAMMLLGPAADPERRGHLEASVAAGRVPEDYLEAADHELHPLFVLGSWDGLWREHLEHDEPTTRLTVSSAVDYLDRQLTYMAGEPLIPFEDFARDLRKCRAHLEAVLHDGAQVERGAPCPECNKPLTFTWAERVADDRWVCHNKGCKVTGYTTSQYRGWVEDDARSSADRLTADDMAIRFSTRDRPLKASTVRVWGAKGNVRKRGRHPESGLTMYDVADVAARLEATERESA